MSAPTTERPRSFERAAALYLAHFSDFRDAWRRDAVGSCWRRFDLDSGEWLRVPELAEVVADTSARLSVVLADEVAPPFVFALVYAPTSEPRNRFGDYLENPVATDADLERCADWGEVRDLLDDRYRARGLGEDSGWSLMIARSQRRRLLVDAGRDSKVSAALRMASGEPALRYSPASPVADRERAFLSSRLLRVPGARVRTSAVHEAYRASLPPGSRAMGAREFRRVVEDFLDAEAVHTKAGDVYLGASLAAEGAATSTSTTVRRSA